MPLSLHVTRVHPDVVAADAEMSVPGLGQFTWLGCLELTPEGGDSRRIFGGISGAFVHGSRLLMVSGMSKLPGPPWWGSGHFFAADLRLQTAQAVSGAPRLLPVGIENMTAQALRTRSGRVRTFEDNGDLESLDVAWPDKALIGMDFNRLVRWFSFGRPADGPTKDLQLSVPQLVGVEHARESGAGLSAALTHCKASGDNLGAQSVAVLATGEVAVFCEHGTRDGTTLGWLAHGDTGEILASYMLPLPEVDGSQHDFYRIAGATAVPSSAARKGVSPELLLLFHFWSPDQQHVSKIARVRLLAGQPSKPLALKLSGALTLRAGAGYPMDNFQAIAIVPAASASSYVVHLVSDNGFDPDNPRTLLLSLHLREERATASDPTVPISRTSLPRWVVKALGGTAISVDELRTTTLSTTSRTMSTSRTTTTLTTAPSGLMEASRDTLKTTLIATVTNASTSVAGSGPKTASTSSSTSVSTASPTSSTTTLTTTSAAKSGLTTASTSISTTVSTAISTSSTTTLTSVSAVSYVNVPGRGFCGDANGLEGRARTIKAGLGCDVVRRICDVDTACVAYACAAETKEAVLYTSTSCIFDCRNTDWLLDRGLITQAIAAHRVRGWATGHCFVKQETVAAMMHLPVDTGHFIKQANLGCGDCEANDVFIGDNGDRSTTAKRPDAPKTCGDICKGSKDCGGFNFVASQERCYFRRSTSCNLFPNEEFDCYTVKGGTEDLYASTALRQSTLHPSRKGVLVVVVLVVGNASIFVGFLACTKRRFNRHQWCTASGAKSTRYAQLVEVHEGFPA